MCTRFFYLFFSFVFVGRLADWLVGWLDSFFHVYFNQSNALTDNSSLFRSQISRWKASIYKCLLLRTSFTIFRSHSNAASDQPTKEKKKKWKNLTQNKTHNEHTQKYFIDQQKAINVLSYGTCLLAINCWFVSVLCVSWNGSIDDSTNVIRCE